jgi:hypothetical protein
VDSYEDCVGMELIILPALLSDYSKTVKLNEIHDEQYCAFLVQQSSVGDVFSQRVDICKPKSIAGDMALASANSKDQLDHSSIHSDDSIESRDGRSESFSLKGPTDKTPAFRFFYPPVQRDLPVGIRCNSVMNVHSSLSKLCTFFKKNKKLVKKLDLGDQSPLFQSLAAVHHYFFDRHNGLKFQGGVLDTALVKGVDDSTSLFPASSKVFQRLIAEDSLMGRDLLLVFRRDLRRDLPKLPSTPKQVAINVPSQIHDSIDTATVVFAAHSSDLSAFVKQFPSSLWEIWKFLFDASGQRLSVARLRQLLLQVKYHEIWSSSRVDQSTRIIASYYSDGLFVKVNSVESGTRQSARTKRRSLLASETSDIMLECTCLQSIADVRKWSSGGSRLNNKEYELTCSSRFCMVPHRLLYSFSSSRNSAIPLPDSSTSLKLNHRSEITTDLRQSLEDSWDISLPDANCFWPQARDAVDSEQNY